MTATSFEISNRHKRLEPAQAEAERLFRAIEASRQFPITPGELSIVFVDDATIAQVHNDFMDDPTPTDVITFPANPEMESAGEIIVSVDHAITRADELGLPFSRELSLYLVHGWLHLAGYDDRNATDRTAMREAEAKALNILDAANLGAGFTLRD
ncbi:MAG: putative rRNA maturation factor [Lentimonas sp.]|jgi:probable rRNA maturation factor